MANGAPQYRASELMQVPERTLRRWRMPNGDVSSDQRPLAVCPTRAKEHTVVRRASTDPRRL
ncbi:hypothetical protein P4S72_27980 [Vibrio sp. PP-XX7]